MKTIYVASRASIPERSEMWRTFRAKGWPIHASWIDEAGPGETASMAELWTRIVVEVSSSKGLVLYAEPSDLPLKGAYVEVGIALAAGLPVRVVWPSTGDAKKLLGSWIEHPLVKMYQDVWPALASL